MNAFHQSSFPKDLVLSQVPCPPKGQAIVYFLRLRSGALYIGASTDLAQRLQDHVSGQACRTTELDPPEALLRMEPHPSFSAARTREAQLKRWSRAKKEALVGGDTHALSCSARSRKKR